MKRTYILIILIKSLRKMDHPIKVFLRSVFSDKPLEQVNRWAQFLIQQRFRNSDDLKNLTNEGWANMDPDIPLYVSAIIKKRVNEKQQPTKQGFFQRVQGIFSSNKSEESERSYLSPTFQTLYDYIKKKDGEFKKVRVKIESMAQLEEIERALQAYMSLAEARQLAAKLFKQLKKDTIVLRPIDIFEASLRKLDVPPRDIDDIRRLIDKGKKLTVRDRLYGLLGSVHGSVQYRTVEEFIIEQISEPIEGSIQIKEKNGLKLFQYKQQLLQSEKASAKTLIVLGETGCGKSTFLNAIVNYIAGVEMEDTFRYIVIVENDNKQMKSLTKDINDYYIKNSRTGQVYRLIDTPGFADTQGIKKDQQLVQKDYKKFKEDINLIHGILFVMKASINRVTVLQQYVFQNVIDLFDKEIARNFVFIFTFSDSGKPQVLESVMDNEIGFGRYWDTLIAPKYIQVNNCGFFEKIEEGDRIKTDYWNIGIKCFDKLFQKIDSIEPKSLKMTIKKIEKQEELNNRIINTTAIIQQAISKRQDIKKHIEKIAFHSDEINNNSNFTYQIEEDQWYAESTSQNVTRCNTARCFAEKNCHVGCNLGDGKEKKKCKAMNKQTHNCMICGCHYTAHTNSKIIRKVRQVTRTIINSENKRKYDLSSSQMKISEAAIKDLFNQLAAEMEKIIGATEEMRILQIQLADAQMSNRKPETTKAYLEYLIQNENREKSPNYLRRIEGYQEAIQEIQLHEKIIQGQGSNDVKKILNQLKEANIQKIIGSKPELFQKMKRLIFN